MLPECFHSAGLLWSWLTPRHHDDRWQLSIFTDWYRSINLHSTLRLSILLWGDGSSRSSSQGKNQPTTPPPHPLLLPPSFLSSDGRAYGNVSVSQEEVANVRTCSWHETEALGAPRCSTVLLSSCAGDRTPLWSGTNCEGYWLAPHISASPRVNKIDGPVTLSSSHNVSRGVLTCSEFTVEHRREWWLWLYSTSQDYLCNI